MTERKWNNKVLELAYSYLAIKECKKCNSPRVDGYCCHFCGDTNPDMSTEEEIAEGLING